MSVAPSLTLLQPFNHGLYVMGGSEAVGKAYLDDLWHLQPCSQLGMCAAFGGRAECQFLSMTNMSTGCVCSEGYVGSNCSAVPPFKPLGPHPNPPNYTAWYIVGALCVCAIVLLAIVVCVARRNRNKSTCVCVRAWWCRGSGGTNTGTSRTMYCTHAVRRRRRRRRYPFGRPIDKGSRADG